MHYIVEPGLADSPEIVGGKGAALASLTGADILIPPWIVVTPEAFKRCLGKERFSDLVAATSCLDAKRVIDGLRPESWLIDALRDHIDRICPEAETLAVRSSAVEEDGILHSFAGLLDSFLSVPLGELPDRIADVWLSAFSPAVFEYRRRKGISIPPSPPAVILQRMVEPQAAGIAFSRDPVNACKKQCVVSAVSGLGDKLASGASNADSYYVDLERRVTDRRQADEHATDDSSQEFVLRDEEIISISELARSAESHFGCPQDIEWALQDGDLFLLQSRPITSLGNTRETEENRTIWDNSNIAESYNGITTPLTYSFASRAYQAVYRQFCITLGVSRKIVDVNRDTFSTLLGLIRGRIYYNLNSWYRILSLLPGFSINQQFMEQMMGVDQSLPEDVRIQIPPASRLVKLRVGFSLLTTAGGLVLHHFILPLTKARFLRRLDQSLAEAHTISKLSTTALGSYYQNLERQLLTKWDAPLINDFFAMVFVGVLRKLSIGWCNAKNSGLHCDLLSEESGIISVEPVRRLGTMADIARKDANLVGLLNTGTPSTIETELVKYPDLQHHIQQYLDDFGYRCLHELKLESPTLHDNPITLFRAIGRLASRNENNESRTSLNTASRRLASEKEMRLALSGHPVKRIIFSWVLRNARARTRDRENLRFERTRVFGTARRIFIALGHRFFEQGLLKTPKDIFYLHVDEILDLVEGVPISTPIEEFVAIRRKEFHEFAQMPTPPDRFETFDAMGEISISPAPSSTMPQDGDSEMRGDGAAGGVIQGRVRIVSDPESTSLAPGEILVAERTDPGWIMLFSAASGVLIEHGSLLSHVSIVTRELRIPAIVSLPGLTEWLKDGDWVEMDGSNGMVRLLSRPELKENPASA